MTKADADELKRTGIAEIFRPATSLNTIIKFIEDNVNQPKEANRNVG